ncbi:MGDG synthase family glycosyltransferase [Deinococcus sp.]|uniref:MGDG synthase family glycosyltransferase n=1 Tax=Deinococcus sp. TaxID=47478 RepID=UPI003C7A5701
MTLPVLHPLRVFEFSAAFGGGHAQASDALSLALEALIPQLIRTQGDFVSYLNRFERLWTLDLYSYWLEYAPGGYRWFYTWTDSEQEPKFITNTFNYLGLPGLLRDLAAAQPGLVLSSFPTNVALADTARRRLGQHFLNVLAVTDYRVHHHWARPEADLLLVASEEAKGQMMHWGRRWGLDESRVAVTGIPISARFTPLLDRTPEQVAALRVRHGLRPGVPLLVVSTGGKGTYPTLGRLLGVLSNLGRPVQVIVTSGRGPKGVERVGGATLHRTGFTLDFPELLAAADLVVGKAGGLTVAETTALGVPMVVYEPIPGQEEYNAEYLLTHAAGLWPRDAHELRRALLNMLDPDERARHSRAARVLGVPDAADRAARAVLAALNAGLGR